MNEILGKITRYNLANYLLPGIIFIIFISRTTKFELIENQNIILVLFLAYFVGIIISRLGSLGMEPFLRKIKFIKFVQYAKYLEVLRKDKKLGILSEENNTYRTYTSLFSIVLIINFIIYLLEKFSIETKSIGIYISTFLLLLFLFSYRKQTKYIKNRVINKLKK